MHAADFRAIGFIFARGGSKGVPGKNIKHLAGKPLIAHSIQIAKDCPSLGSVFVSTDDAEIANVAREFGAQVPFMRPVELATDTAPEWLAWRHAIEWAQHDLGKFDAFVSLPTTSPFRSVADVEACIDILRNDPHADAVITVRPAERSPYFNMVTLDKDGYAGLVCKPGDTISRRQDAPIVYDITTVAYAVRPEFILQASKLFDGRIRTVTVPPERAMDIDTPYDFLLAEAISEIRNRQA